MRLNILVLLALFTFKLTFSSSYELPSYDLEPITPEAWRQVELTYSDVIKGKEYPAEIKLLRPIDWLKDNGIDEVGNKAVFSLPEFGVESVEVEVVSVLPTTVDTSRVDWAVEKSRPVIGKFKRYAEDVRTYTFRDASGNVETINVTPNHPFYVKNKGEFVAIDDVASSDELIDQLGKSIKLSCPLGKEISCGEQYNKSGKPVVVYNLEVYKNHVYFVGGDALLVHNNCVFDNEAYISSIGKTSTNTDGHVVYQGYVYRGDDRPYKDLFANGMLPKKIASSDIMSGSNDTRTYGYGISASTSKSIASRYGKYIYLIDTRDSSLSYDINKNFILKNPSYNLDSYYDNLHKAFGQSMNMHEINIAEPVPSTNIVGVYKRGFFSNKWKFLQNENWVGTIM
jgi:hypothetical protein